MRSITFARRTLLPIVIAFALHPQTLVPPHYQPHLVTLLAILLVAEAIHQIDRRDPNHPRYRERA